MQNLAWGTASSRLTFYIGNDYRPDLFKEVWVWWKYAGSEDMETGNVTLTAYDESGKEMTGVKDVDGDVSLGLQEGFRQWIIVPQPEWEKIVWKVPPHDVIEEVAIGTHCTPEASTWLLLASSAVNSLVWFIQAKVKAAAVTIITPDSCRKYTSDW